MINTTTRESKDLDWLDRIGDGVRGKCWQMFWALANIAEDSHDADARTKAQAALDQVYAYTPPAPQTTTLADALDEIF